MWKSTNQRGIKNEIERGIQRGNFKNKRGIQSGIERGTQEIKRNQCGIQSGNQKTSNKLKTKKKNLGCLVEKMSQVLR
jgi:hypothetical protein